jgi:homoserine kinase
VKIVTVKIPATTLGMALSFYDSYEAEVVSSGLEISVSGEGVGDIPLDESNLIYKSLALVFNKLGKKVPGLKIRCENNIPHGRGMGSSGAAVAGGIMLAAGILQDEIEISEQQLLGFATELEGHPDNVAPALFGGLTIAWVEEDGVPRHKKLTVHRGVSPLVLVPPHQMSTKLARSLQPESVPHTDAVFNVSRSALLVAALTQSPELMLAATEDRLHQSYRSSAMPETSALIKKDHEHPAVVSGAGPSVLVLEDDPAKRMAAIALVESSFPDWRVLALAVDVKGASLLVQSGSGT